MKENLEVLIIPDVHGREFWIKPVKDVLENSDKPVIFLGDYLDPYDYEWEGTGIYPQEHAIEVFKQVIDIKKQYPDRVTLLIGNHDCGYSLDLSICQSRMNYSRAGEIGKLFSDNWNLFKLADKRVIGGKPFIFSHAGLSKEFAEYAFPEVYKLGSDAVIEMLNNSLAVKDEKLIQSLGIYSTYRGWGGMHFGSVVWSDLREWVFGEAHSIDDSMQIVGHTQLEKTVRMKDVICDLDVREAFYIDKEGEIKHMDSDEPVLVNEMANMD